MAENVATASIVIDKEGLPPMGARADGVDLALRFYQFVAIAGPMLRGGTNRVEMAVCSIPALLAMKGQACLEKRGLTWH